MSWFEEIANNADFYSKENQAYYVSVMQSYNFKITKPIVFLPCASQKPISKSRTHCYLSPITRNNLFEKIILSEPQTIIPYTMEATCPNYDYPPGQLTPEDRWQLVRRLGIFLYELQSQNPHLTRIYYIGGIHHLKVLTEANQNIKTPFQIISEVPKRGIRDYYAAAKDFQKRILKKEGFIQSVQKTLL